MALDTSNAGKHQITDVEKETMEFQRQLRRAFTGVLCDRQTMVAVSFSLTLLEDLCEDWTDDKLNDKRMELVILEELLGREEFWGNDFICVAAIGGKRDLLVRTNLADGIIVKSVTQISRKSWTEFALQLESSKCPVNVLVSACNSWLKMYNSYNINMMTFHKLKSFLPMVVNVNSLEEMLCRLMFRPEELHDALEQWRVKLSPLLAPARVVFKTSMVEYHRLQLTDHLLLLMHFTELKLVFIDDVILTRKCLGVRQAGQSVDINDISINKLCEDGELTAFLSFLFRIKESDNDHGNMMIGRYKSGNDLEFGLPLPNFIKHKSVNIKADKDFVGQLAHKVGMRGLKGGSVSDMVGRIYKFVKAQANETLDTCGVCQMPMKRSRRL